MLPSLRLSRYTSLIDAEGTINGYSFSFDEMNQEIASSTAGSPYEKLRLLLDFHKAYGV